jgi:isoleucyl-tRNA synthetase
MIANRPDWCISRQRNWGVPIPFFIHKETGELHPDTPDLMEQVAQRVEREGIDAWFNLDASRAAGRGSSEAVRQDERHARRVVRLRVPPTGTCCADRTRTDLAWPADLYLEGSDQHRGWFHSSLLTGCAIDGHAPYRRC